MNTYDAFAVEQEARRVRAEMLRAAFQRLAHRLAHQRGTQDTGAQDAV